MIKNLLSDNKRILLLSDIHQDVARAEYLLTHENYDIAVHLGDFFDSFIYNSQYDLQATCKFIKKWIFREDFLTLHANHDLQYFYNNPYTICSGYEESKDNDIAEIFGDSLSVIREKFLWGIWVDDFLCSHAGINTYFFPPYLKITKEAISEWLNKEAKIADSSLINGNSHWFFRAGSGRGGSQKVGGLVWQDWDSEFEPIEGIKQIVGHSFHKNIVNHYSYGSLDLTQAENLCIDCNINQYIIIENKKVQIKNYMDL